MGAFRRAMDFYDVHLDYVSKSPHWKLGRAESGNDYWRHIFNKVVNENMIVGPQEVDMAIVCVSHAKNDGTKRCGASSYMAAFGREPRVPDILLGIQDDLGTHSQITQSQWLQRRNEIRASAHRAFYDTALDNSMRKSILSQARPYRGDYAAGEEVAFWNVPNTGHKSKDRSGMRGTR